MNDVGAALTGREGNVEDRRKEMFRSHPQAPQDPNVFWDNLTGYQLLLNLRPEDFAKIVGANPVGEAAGVKELDEEARKYFDARK